MKNPDLSLILPVHNQEKIIAPVYRDIVHMLDRLKISYECILVENGSSDATLGVLTTLARSYPHTRVYTAPKGYGSAVLRGLGVSRGVYVSYMPSDGQIDLGVFPILWQLATSRKWQLVKIQRATRESLSRSACSSLFSAIVRILFHTSVTDINGSPRIFLRKYVPVLDLGYRDSFIDAEFAAKARVLGWNIKEIPMRTLPRVGGTSTRSWRTFIEFFTNIWHYKTGSAFSDWKHHVTHA